MNRPLDRERIPEYKLTISVKDNPENPRIARRVRLEGMGEVGEHRPPETHRPPGQGVECTGGWMHRPSEQVLSSNPRPACQRVCDFG